MPSANHQPGHWHVQISDRPGHCDRKHWAVSESLSAGRGPGPVPVSGSESDSGRDTAAWTGILKPCLGWTGSDSVVLDHHYDRLGQMPRPCSWAESRLQAALDNAEVLNGTGLIPPVIQEFSARRGRRSRKAPGPRITAAGRIASPWATRIGPALGPWRRGVGQFHCL